MSCRGRGIGGRGIGDCTPPIVYGRRRHCTHCRLHHSWLQVLFSQELQHRASRHAAAAGSARAVATFSLHPGTVRSGIVPLPAWLVRPTAIGARVLLYCLLPTDY